MLGGRKALACAAALVGAAIATPGSAVAADPLAGLRTSCRVERSTDVAPAPRVSYRLCEGRIASYDGTMLDATLTLPGAARPGTRLPLVVFLHGFLDSKAEYLSRARLGTGADRGGGAYKTVLWNNVWFASRGYAVLNYSARGHGGSGGEIGLASKHVEVRDTRFLTGLIADEAARRTPLVSIDPRRVGVIGSSYGGGQAWLLATTRAAGASEAGTWRSPGRRTVRLAAAVPGYTWTDLFHSLIPNGRQLSTGVVDPATTNRPVGVGKLTLIDGFIATAGSKFTAEIVRWLSRFNAGEPYDSPSDPVIPEARRALTEDRSAYYQRAFFDGLRARRQRRIPILVGQGWTDPIFPALESVRMYRRLRASSAGYPIQLYFGDFEHLTALVKIPDLRHFHVLGNHLLDHFVLQRRPRPRFDAESAVTNCDPARFGPLLRASSWDGLHPARLTLELPGGRQTTSPVSDERAPDYDPVVVSQRSGRGCIRSGGTSPPGVASWTVPVTKSFTLLGMPRVRVRYRPVGTDLLLNARLWDVEPSGERTLVDRGAHRAINPNPAGAVADYELFGNAWRFRAGHSLMLELVQDDSSYLRRDNFPSSTTVDGVRLTLPVHGRAP